MNKAAPTQTILVDLVIFPFHVVVHVSEDPTTLLEQFPKLGLNCELHPEIEEDILNMNPDDVCGTWYPYINSCGIIYLNGQLGNVTVLAHEVAHCVDSTMDMIRSDCSELRGYLTQHIMGCCITGLKLPALSKEMKKSYQTILNRHPMVHTRMK